jgi:hypothetical protein
MFRQITEQTDGQNIHYARLMTEVHIRMSIDNIKKPRIECSRLV